MTEKISDKGTEGEDIRLGPREDRIMELPAPIMAARVWFCQEVMAGVFWSNARVKPRS